jgi:anti-anti-sigma regulatory factor
MILLCPKQDGQPRLLKLSGSCDVRMANELHSSLQEICADELPATVDCTAVESIDTACTQLLIAAKREALHPLTISFHDSEAAKWFEIGGVASYLGSSTSAIPQWAAPNQFKSVE